MRRRVQPALLRYGYGVLAVIIALAVARMLEAFDLEGFLFVIAVAMAVWFGGRGAGVLAIVLSIPVLHYFFVAPRDTGSTLGNYVYFAVFGVLVVLITALSETRHRTEQSLNRSRDELEMKVQDQASLLDLTHDTIFVRDLDDIITYWNRGAEELYGWRRHEARGQVAHTLLQTTFPAPLAEIKAELLRTRRWEGELIHTKRDGTQVVVASRWSLQQDEHGGPVAILETNNDITERKRTEVKLRQAQADLAHVSRVTTLGEMAASIAHEVDQPLSGVVINANACLRFLNGATPDLDEVRDGLQAIARDGRRASDVIGRIRSLARRTATEKEPLDINEVIREVVGLAEGEVRRARARFRTELGSDLPRVLGDRVQLQQVVLNLMLNGLEAMDGVEGRPRELVIRTHREANDRVQVAVQDSGSGIDAETATRIFDPFYTTKPGGMGMGLSISRTIVEQHGGWLRAAPNDGPGTTFHFTV